MTNKQSCVIIKIQKGKEIKTMRLIRYYIVNKTAGKAIDTDCRKANLEACLQGLVDKENYTIASKWMSI